jgi:Luciferase-like monooxygenase
VPRRRPAQLAREIATLDRLSEGRMILGAVLGEPVGNEYGRVGAPTDLKVLAGMCDEGLEAITLLWSAEPVSFHGRYVTVDDVVMRPAPLQQPRVPVFIGGTWPRQGPARRAARWDGSALHAGTAWEQPPDPAVIAQMRAFFQARRRESGRENEPFDLVAGDQPRVIRARLATSRSPRRCRGDVVGRALPLRPASQGRRGSCPHRARPAAHHLTGRHRTCTQKEARITSRSGVLSITGYEPRSPLRSADLAH